MKETEYAEVMHNVIAHPTADQCPDIPRAVALSQLSPWFVY